MLQLIILSRNKIKQGKNNESSGERAMVIIMMVE